MLRGDIARMASSARRPRKPEKSILDPEFRYRPSHATDIRETFARARRELERAHAPQQVRVNVVPLNRPNTAFPSFTHPGDSQ